MDYVDLGLPSGTKWAVCNLGASTPSKRGILYSFVEAMTAAKLMGGRVPSQEDFLELENNCKCLFADCGVVKGQIYIGKNGNSIFLPIYGDGDGDIWLSTPEPNSDEIYTLWLEASEDKDGNPEPSWLGKAPSYACSVRMVIK